MLTSAYSRRGVLKRLGLAGLAAATLPDLSRVLLFQREVLAAQQPSAAAPTVTALSAEELATLTAACARIIPTDENGPGATEARASLYIDRSLAGWLSPWRQSYADGLALLDQTARTKNGKRFVDLGPADQDAVLHDIEETPFFGLVRAHTIQGTFCDPAYGGNANFAGWDLLGYPGLRLSVSADDQRMGARPQPARRSAYDYAMFSAMGAGYAH